MKKFTLLLILFPFWCIAQIPTYYNQIDFSQTGNALKSQLSTLITTTHTYQLIYTPEVWNALKQTDLDPANSQNVLLIYGYNDTDGITSNDRTRSKDLSCHTSSCAGFWVREHTFAQSLGTPPLGQENAGSDAHHLRAIDSQMNGSRSNRPFISGSGNAGIVSGSWYPGDEWKGDVARMMMYMYLRYETQCDPTDVGSGSTSYSPHGDMPNIFLEWNQQDPVSQYEINRNNILQAIQGNRNPFIDNPYLATIIWNGPTATDTWGLLSKEDYPINKILLYPTVTTGIINIENADDTDFTLTAYSSLGQQINLNINNNVIDLGDNASGVYFITLQIGTDSKVIRVVKK